MYLCAWKPKKNVLQTTLNNRLKQATATSGEDVIAEQDIWSKPGLEHLYISCYTLPSIQVFLWSMKVETETA